MFSVCVLLCVLTKYSRDCVAFLDLPKVNSLLYGYSLYLFFPYHFIQSKVEMCLVVSLNMLKQAFLLDSSVKGIAHEYV